MQFTRQIYDGICRLILANNHERDGFKSESESENESRQKWLRKVTDVIENQNDMTG